MLGKDLNASFGLASSTLSIILQATGLCFVLALSNIIPQAYGAKNYKLCGAYLNRMIIVNTLIFVPFLIPLQFIEPLLVAI
jgi:Na+-driven multidrug efflux pump